MEYISVDITKCIREFYLLECMNILKKVTPFRHSHEKWLEDFNDYRDTYIDKLEQAIYDYTVMVVGGEIRHAYNHCSIYNPNAPIGGSRDSSYTSILEYTPESIAYTAYRLFNDADYWEHGYGGKPWANIAKTINLRNKLPKVAYIDHCVDLSHNTSPYFDKYQSNIFLLDSKHAYINLLNTKKDCSPMYLINYIGRASRHAYKLYKRAINLDILSHNIEIFIDLRQNHAINFILDYTPINWGTTKLKHEIKKGKYYCEDEQDYY